MCLKFVKFNFCCAGSFSFWYKEQGKLQLRPAEVCRFSNFNTKSENCDFLNFATCFVILFVSF